MVTNHAEDARIILRHTEDTIRHGGEGLAAQIGVGRALVHALLAVTEAVNNIRPAGACPSTIRTGMFTSNGPEVFYCRHPDRHTGLHSNDPAMTEDNIEARWTDHSEGVTRVNQEQP